MDTLVTNRDSKMKSKVIKIETEDGYKIGALVQEPQGKAKACIQINSGAGVPKEYYKNFATYCAEQGYVTITYDYRGIGGSKPDKLRGFKASYHDWGVLDMTAVLDWSINNYPHLKKNVLGHSMGGQLIGFMKNGTKIDKITIIASGTGYWKDMPYGNTRKMMPLLWYVYMPLSTFVFGYANAKLIKQGENLPKGIALEWRKWCIRKGYWDSDFGKTINPDFFEQITVPIDSITFTDDRIISKRANEKLLAYFPNAKIHQHRISPYDFNLKELGHFHFFSRKSKNLWSEVIHNHVINHEK